MTCNQHVQKQRHVGQQWGVHVIGCLRGEFHYWSISPKMTQRKHLQVGGGLLLRLSMLYLSKSISYSLNSKPGTCSYLSKQQRLISWLFQFAHKSKLTDHTQKIKSLLSTKPPTVHLVDGPSVIKTLSIICTTKEHLSKIHTINCPYNPKLKSFTWLACSSCKSSTEV